MDERVEEENKHYPNGINVNKEILNDLNNEVTDEEIIRKLEAVSDLNMALWGDGGMGRLTYVPLHHAASRNRIELVLFILDHRIAPEYVNFENDNFYTALRYAQRNGHHDMIRILEEHGAVEAFPPLVIACKSCGEEFTHSSFAQAKFQAEGFQTPKTCRPCRDRKKNNGGGDRGDRGDGSRPGSGRGGGRGRVDSGRGRESGRGRVETERPRIPERERW